MEPPPQAGPSPAVRVLSRTPPPPASSSPSPPPPAATPPSHDGVVAVGFVGGGGTACLADRILDAHVFSPGGSARTLAGGVRYHRDGEKRVVFLHLAPSPPTPLEGAGDLRELLFMFSVCHVIIFLQEGFRFDTQILKKFRLLQSSKHAIAPFVKSLVAPAVPSKVARSNTPTKPTHRASSISPPARRGGRHPSAISLMSGTGSHPCMLPGLCIPVVLFVFEDDITDAPGAPTSPDDTNDTSSSNQASNTDGLPKPNMTSKGSSSVVMLARPAIRSDGTFSKKLHSSVEGQIRFLLKKCRTLVGLEPGHIVSRGVSNVSHLPLFSLDTSRVVALLDRSISKKREPLDIIAGLFEDSLTSKSSLDVSSLENNCHPATHEDVQFIKDFIFRQSDGLRGRGGHSSNTTAGPVSGVGMVAAAAAAAAASAASGKQMSAPDLPTFDTWLSISSSILSALFSGEDGLSSSQNMKASPTHTSSFPKNDQLPSAGSNAIQTALSCLEGNKGLNVKFSSSWCQRILPAAKEVYLKDLPAFYPTSMHEVQLQKALRSFHSMVKGPAVQVFSKKLKDECQAIWESGRQQCDAVSLTGRPCKHQRHGKSSPSDAALQHSSGYVFLHACACGRSRRLRDDPFDFEAANVTFNCFSNCEDLLPTLVLPRETNAGAFPVSSWRLVRLGGARYYKPTKGLLQAGFCSKEKYLLRWTISLGKGQGKHGTHATNKPFSTASNADPQAPPIVAGEVKSAVTQVTVEIKSMKLENSRKQPEVESMNNSSINFGKGLPNFTMKKPFAEVVAGHTARDSEFPALQQKRPLKPGNWKDERQVSGADQTNGRGHPALSQGPIADNESEKVSRDKSNGSAGGKPFLQIGSNIVPMVVGKETKEVNQSIQQFMVYVGFEHECSYGHRFLLSEKHLKEIDSSYLQFERSNLNNEAESKHGSQKLPQNASRLAATMDVTSGGKLNRPMDSSGRNSQQQLLKPRVDAETLQPSHWLSDPQNERKGELSLQYVTLDDGGDAFSLLNRNLPIYMHCPHCKSSDRKGNQDAKVAAAVSQLQRIFIASCLPSNASDHDQQGSFSLGCRVVLPPESFLTMRLPFVYGVETRDGNTAPLKYLEEQPELTAWLVGGTALQIVSVGHTNEKEAPL
uniref:Nonsense-mediated mRNA decay factor SMG8 n=1 Tax=Oryza barthii TaxID=65489 RepID=A0A0D3FC97_9ORYZ